MTDAIEQLAELAKKDTSIANRAVDFVGFSVVEQPQAAALMHEMRDCPGADFDHLILHVPKDGSSPLILSLKPEHIQYRQVPKSSDEMLEEMRKARERQAAYWKQFPSAVSVLASQ